MDRREIGRVLHRQTGVIARRQVLEAGGSDVDIERLLRRRQWTRVHGGVYVSHTGPMSWLERAWAAVLLLAPAALADSSALRAHGLRGHDRGEQIEVAVDATRTPAAPVGIRTVRLPGFAHVAALHLSPPRLRLERAVLRVASRARSDEAAVAVLADACQSGRTLPGRLEEELGSIVRIGRRGLMRDVLADISTGAMSALERRYLRDVERAHGLPRGRRQVRGTGVVRDVEYPRYFTRVELDGRLGHEWSSDRSADLDRDIDSALEGSMTVRIGWVQVVQPCRLADRLAVLLSAHGWSGTPHPCCGSCPVGR